MNSRQILAVLAIAGASALAGCSSSTCGPASCTGCCDTSGICQQDSSANCGLGGNACTSCIGAESCVLGICEFAGGANGGAGGNTNGVNGANSGTASGSGGTSQGTISSSSSAANSGGISSSSASSSNTGGTSSSHGSSSGAASSGGGSTGGGSICATCSNNNDCASGFCNTEDGTSPFCDTRTPCESAANCDELRTCAIGAISHDSDCACPQLITVVTNGGNTTGTTGSTGTFGGSTTGTFGGSTTGTFGGNTTGTFGGSTSGGTGLPICATCTVPTDCASGYCNVQDGVSSFCDSAQPCDPSTSATICGAAAICSALAPSDCNCPQIQSSTPPDAGALSGFCGPCNVDADCDATFIVPASCINHLCVVPGCSAFPVCDILSATSVCDATTDNCTCP